MTKNLFYMTHKEDSPLSSFNLAWTQRTATVVLTLGRKTSNCLEFKRWVPPVPTFLSVTMCLELIQSSLALKYDTFF
uniref:Uncharacterized protein n=1 Tax=Anguilla anguilla TaxID=7936 RepID=A0A0E9X990_ANGAN